MDDGCLVIDWMDSPPAPEAGVEVLACNCQRSCTQDKCPCIKNRLKCTDLCKLKICDNQMSEDDEELEFVDIKEIHEGGRLVDEEFNLIDVGVGAARC